MNQDTQVQTVGEELGRMALEEVLSKAHTYCECEKQRIALSNDAKITGLRAELALLREEQQKLEQRLRELSPRVMSKNVGARPSITGP